MKIILLPESTPKRYGFAYDHKTLFVVSECCLKRVLKIDKRYRCSECGSELDWDLINSPGIIFWLSEIPLSEEEFFGSKKLVKWAKAWTGLDDVEFSVCY